MEKLTIANTIIEVSILLFIIYKTKGFRFINPLKRIRNRQRKEYFREVERLIDEKIVSVLLRHSDLGIEQKEKTTKETIEKLMDLKREIYYL